MTSLFVLFLSMTSNAQVTKALQVGIQYGDGGVIEKTVQGTPAHRELRTGDRVTGVHFGMGPDDWIEIKPEYSAEKVVSIAKPKSKDRVSLRYIRDGQEQITRLFPEEVSYYAPYGFSPEKTKELAENASIYFKKCRAFETAEKRSMVEKSFSDRAYSPFRTGSSTNGPYWWSSACTIKTSEGAWIVEIKGNGHHRPVYNSALSQEEMDQKPDQFKSTEIISYMTNECLEDRFCSSSGNKHIEFLDFKPKDSNTNMEPHYMALWNKTISGKANEQKTASLKAACLKGDRKSCTALFTETSHADPSTLEKACSLKVDIACDKINAAKANEQAKQEEANRVQLSKENAKRKLESNECKVAQLTVAYCKDLLAVRMIQMQIDHEKAVGAETGYVNAVKINQNVSARMIVEGRSRSTAAQIQKIQGRAPADANAVCGIVDQDSFNAVITVPVERIQKETCY